jgi:hypothetical protein
VVNVLLNLKRSCSRRGIEQNVYNAVKKKKPSSGA